MEIFDLVHDYGTCFTGIIRRMVDEKCGRGVRDKDIPSMIGVPPKLYARWEKYQEHPPIDRKEIDRIAAALGYYPDDLLYELLTDIARVQQDLELQLEPTAYEMAYYALGHHLGREEGLPREISIEERSEMIELAKQIEEAYRAADPTPEQAALKERFDTERFKKLLDSPDAQSDLDREREYQVMLKRDETERVLHIFEAMNSLAPDEQNRSVIRAVRKHLDSLS